MGRDRGVDGTDWSGMSTKTNAERQAEFRQRAKDGEPWAPKPHGTTAAARRHQRAKEPLCEACAEVWATYQAKMYKQRKLRLTNERAT